MNKFRIAIASGKGGTGKTTVSLFLAQAFTQAGISLCLADCDVEEPNDRLFFKKGILQETEFYIPVPEIEREKCTGCGKCRNICAFNAIAIAGGKAMVFEEMCHSCGGCALICTYGAIKEVKKYIGQIRISSSDGISLVDGILNIGSIASVPLIKEVKKYVSQFDHVIIDSPPGTSCSAVSALCECDYVVVVCEPTLFGINDMKIMAETIEKMSIPYGIVINRSNEYDSLVFDYAKEKNIPIITRFAYDERVAYAYSEGRLLEEGYIFVEEQAQILAEFIRGRA